MRWVKGIILLLAGLLLTYAAKAQNADDVLRYSLQQPAYDATSMVLPGVAYPTGFGAYQENPASMALFDESFLSFSLSSRYVEEEGAYLGSRTSFDDSETNVGDLGFVYDFPTTRGSLVVGAGYSQTSDFNRALAGGGFNDGSTLTDFYNITPDDSLFFAAFDAYALDFLVDQPDSIVSIFRAGGQGFPYQGIDQDFKLTERGRMGEYSAFIATEFQENLMVGASIALFEGGYHYSREFLESDRRNLYDGDFIDADGDGEFETDIHEIENEDTIDATFTAFSARLGAIYRVTPNVLVGASYRFPSTLHFEEEFNTEIRSTFDNGMHAEDDAPGRFEYKIVSPNRIHVGASARDLGLFSLSASAEYVPYASGRIEFDELDLRPLQEDINENVRAQMEDVWNLRGGMEVALHERFTPRLGYAWYPSPRSALSSSADRQIFSAGFSAQLSDILSLDVGVQYAAWEDENSLYTYRTGPGQPTRSETVAEDISRVHGMIGLRMRL